MADVAAFELSWNGLDCLTRLIRGIADGANLTCWHDFACTWERHYSCDCSLEMLRVALPHTLYMIEHGEGMGSQGSGWCGLSGFCVQRPRLP